MSRFSRRRKFVNHKKKIMYFSLFFLLLLVSVGYAYLNAALSINGSTTIAANTWDIHFENLSISAGSVAATTPAAISGNTTSINYSVLLSRPGDYYEFSVDVVNAGTLSGKISLVNVQGITSAAEPYLESSIKYITDEGVQVNDLLNPGASKRIVVRVGYKEDLNSLPDGDIPLNLTCNINYSQTNEEEKLTTDDIIQELIVNDSSCFIKYNQAVTDNVGETVTPSKVFFNKCLDKRHFKFAGYCWQMVRTTENNGVKIIYNGEPDGNGECGYLRGKHKGIVQSNYDDQILNSSYLYGSSFDYDIINGTFTLTDTTIATWSDATYENLIGKYTCKSTSSTCETLYNINGYKSSSEAFASAYTIDNTNYALVAETSFNANGKSPAMVGYMFNKVYNISYNAPANDSLMGNDVSYSNGMYTLLPADGDNSLNQGLGAKYHYTCNNSTGICNIVRYYYTSSHYIDLVGGEKIEDVVNNMLYSNNVNKYNSSVKGIIDAWYAKELSNKTTMLEDIVYCNDRSVINPSTNSWNKDSYLENNMEFKSYDLTVDLACTNLTDQFARRYNKAKLTYPVGLLNHAELYMLGSGYLTYIQEQYLSMSPYFVEAADVNISGMSLGGLSKHKVFLSRGARPTVSLVSGTVITGGEGSTTDPWIVE